MHRCKNNKFLKLHVIKNIRHVNIRKNETLQIFSLVKLQNSDLTIMLFQKGILENFEYWKSCSLFYKRKLLWIVIYFCGSADIESTCNAGDLGSILGLGRSPGEGKGYPLQYSGLENSMDYVVHGVTKSQT